MGTLKEELEKELRDEAAGRKGGTVCKTCAWLRGLGDEERQAWNDFFADASISGGVLVSAIIQRRKVPIGETALLNHRRKGHIA